MAHISLDGVIQPGERDDGNDSQQDTPSDWTAPYRGAAGAEVLAGMQGDSFDLLLGRRTYDLWAGFWPKITSGPFAKGLNAATKYVATHRPDSLTWGPAEALGANMVESVRNLKQTERPDLVIWGSSTLTSVLLEAGLIDEVVLIVYPVLLGLGTRFFSDSVDPRELAFVNTKATASGVLINTYRHIGSLSKKL